jgi:hypothetical protein
MTGRVITGTGLIRIKASTPISASVFNGNGRIGVVWLCNHH